MVLLLAAASALCAVGFFVHRGEAELSAIAGWLALVAFSLWLQRA